MSVFLTFIFLVISALVVYLLQEKFKTIARTNMLLWVLNVVVFVVIVGAELLVAKYFYAKKTTCEFAHEYGVRYVIENTP